jgi:hypothetical protein
MRILFTPSGTKNSGGLAYDPGDLTPEFLVVVTPRTDSLDPHVGTQVDGIPATSVGPPQRHLQGNSAVSEENAGDTGTSVREGQFACTLQCIRNLADRSSELIRDLQGVGFGTKRAREHIPQL